MNVMNLSAYDAIHNKLNKQKTWIDIRNKKLLSRELRYRPYTTFGKSYNPTLKDTEYFIILLDDTPTDRVCVRTHKDDYGRIKISLASIWKDCELYNATEDFNISLIHVEHADDGDIYKLDF